MENVHQLRVFGAVADTLSFTRAAERVFLTQSAVSHQIAKLERDMGCQLLTREGRTVALTAAGRVLAKQSERIFATIDSVILAAQQAAKPGIGRIRIGASSTACQYIIPEALREFRESFPHYSLAITPGDSPMTFDHLIAGTIDLGLLVRPERTRKLQFHRLFDDELLLAVSPLHPWAKAGKVDRRELSDQQMVLYSRNSATFKLVERHFAKLQAPLRNWIELGDIGAMKELVKLGLGISVMAPWVAAPEVRDGSLVLLPLPGPKLKRPWCIASVTGRALSIAEQTFIGLCQAVAARIQ